MLKPLFILTIDPYPHCTVSPSFSQLFTNPQLLITLIRRCHLVTVIEVLPKEKKQKEEKTAVIGQAIVDLLPLLHGERPTH